MLAINLELTAVIYALYAIDCIHWLAPGQTAFTRRINGEWKRWPYQEESFTLLGKMPVVVNPFDVRPGWIVLNAPLDTKAGRPEESIAWFFEKLMPNGNLLTAVSLIAGFNLLILLPALALTGFLVGLWQIPVGILIATQTILVIEFYSQSKLWRIRDSNGFWREFLSMVLNPIAAVRCSDVLCRALYSIYQPGSST
jgi:hypothetical protein